MTLWKRILSRYLSDAKKSRIRQRHDRKNMVSQVIDIGCRNESVSGKRKTVPRSVESDHSEVKKKQKITGNNGVSDRISEIDPVSVLPVSIIHHIFSFLRCTKDLVRTTVLSKNWKGMFDSYDSFDFDQRWFKVRRGKGKHNRINAREMQKKMFERYVNKSVATRLETLPSIYKFRLYANKIDDSLVVSIRRWTSIAMNKNVKELEIQVYTDGFLLFPIYVVVSKSIFSLKLAGCVMLYNFSVIQMSKLRELSIKHTRLLTACIMKNFEASCPLLEDLRLIRCSGINHLTISTLVKLRRVEVHDCVAMNRIDIAASNLESFWYHARMNQRCNIDLKGADNLKILTLKDSTITDSAFQEWILKCPLLETLVLYECNLEKIKIFSGKLKRLALIQCEKLCEADIDAPNLCSLEYSGNMMPFNFRSINAQAKFSFSVKTKPRSQWTLGYQGFSRILEGLKGYILIVYSKLSMKIFEEPSEAPLDGYNFEKIELTVSSASVVKTVDNWLRECHGKSLKVVSSNSELINLISKMITEKEDDPSCCRYYSNKCWRHYIEDVQISAMEIGSVTCYDFTWRSRKR